MINILLNGCNGNMGKAIIEHVNKMPDFNVLYGIDKDNTDLYNNITQKPDIIIDFSTVSATFAALNYAVENLIPIVIATTGFSQTDNQKIAEFAEAIPIFKSSNMSYAIHLFTNVASTLAKKLKNADIEIIEKHHRMKKDAPSGTALMLANSINKKCGISSIRGGGLVGEHSVLFLGENETIEITHTAYSRNIYVEGALDAARFIITKKNGLFSMEDLV